MRDLAAAGARFAEEFGLDSIEGGRHPAWGTVNRIVPVGGAYVELVGVVDPVTAASSAFGRWVLEAVIVGDSLLGWAVATDDIDGDARRLNLEVAAGSRVNPTGLKLGWRVAGLERSVQQTAYPFFIQWDCPPELHPARGRVAHRVMPPQIAGIEVTGDDDALRAWLGEGEVPVRTRPGPPRLVAVVIAAGKGEVVLT